MDSQNFKYRIIQCKKDPKFFTIEVMAYKMLYLFERWIPLSYYPDVLELALYEETPLRVMQREAKLGHNFLTMPVKFLNEDQAGEALRLFQKSIVENSKRNLWINAFNNTEGVYSLEDLLTE